jgi:hypothetical protein
LLYSYASFGFFSVQKEMTLMNDARQHARLPQGRTSSIALRIAKFGTMEKRDMSVRAVDISAEGMGVESDVPVDPGFVWFCEGAGHHQCGVVVWTGECGNKTCRAGIKFIPLGSGLKIAADVRSAYPYPLSCRAPELVACMLVDEFTS